MKKILLFLLLILMICCGYAQTKGTIKKAYAFLMITMPGTIMAGEGGQPAKLNLNISRYIYIESAGRNKPVIENVQYRNEIFKVNVMPVTLLPVEIGVQKENGKPIKLNAAKGNSLWRLELEQTDGKKIRKEEDHYKNILVKEKVKNRYFKFIIDKEIELEGLLTM